MEKFVSVHEPTLIINLFFTQNDSKYFYVLFLKYRVLYAFFILLLYLSYFMFSSAYWALSVSVVYTSLIFLPILFFNVSITLELLKGFQIFFVFTIFLL